MKPEAYYIVSMIRILNEKNIIYFYRNNVLVATLCADPGRCGVSGDGEQQQTLCVLNALCSDHSILLLSFPLLRIGI